MKRFTAILLSIFTLFALTACQPTPEAAVVVRKDTDRMVEQAVGDGESAALPLREQLAAPDMINVTAEEDGFTILAHASVILPETDAIPVITVKAGSFSQELTNRLWDLLIGDKAMYKPRTEDDRTKAELEQAIINIQNDIERIQHNEYYEENKALREAELEHLRKLYGAAPDIYEPAAATPEIEQYVDSSNPSRRFIGVDATDNAGTIFRLSNEAWYEALGKGGKQNSNFVYCTPGYNGIVYGKNSTIEVNENDTLENTAHPGLPMQPKQAAETVQHFLSSLNVPMRIERIALYDNAAMEGDVTKGTSDWCYLVTCQRMVEQYACAAIFGFSDWASPLEICDISVYSCNLLPFSEIQQIFEKMVRVIWQYQAKDCLSLTCNITEARLELMRVLEQGSTDNGLLIPVWNFYGTRQRSFASGNTDETLHGNMLTITAIDGSILDRAMGY